MKRDIPAMHELSKNEIQSLLIMMMKDIHSFCIKNDIKYSLAYGSLIGAIRHKGFIPWDDDIDIWMPRPDYERFLANYSSCNGYFMKSVYDDDCYTNFTRVYEVQKTRLISPAKPCEGDVGIWIDILPIDGVSDNEQIRIKEYEDIKLMAERIMTMRGNLAKIQNGTVIEKIEHFVKYKIKCFLWGSIAKIHVNLQDKINKHSYGTTTYCANLCCLDALKKGEIELLQADYFKQFILSQFEDTQFLITTDYDKILTAIYGDYMKLPPISQRGERHRTHFFYGLDG